jgi:hypothetical protein
MPAFAIKLPHPFVDEFSAPKWHSIDFEDYLRKSIALYVDLMPHPQY